MDKSTLIDEVAEAANIKKRDAKLAIDAMLGIITKKVTEGEDVTLQGFGSWRRVLRGERSVNLPTLKEGVIAPAHYSVKFKPGKTVRDSLASVPVE